MKCKVKNKLWFFLLCDKDVASIIVCLSLLLDWSRSYVLASWVDVRGSNLEGMCFTSCQISDGTQFEEVGKERF